MIASRFSGRPRGRSTRFGLLVLGLVVLVGVVAAGPAAAQSGTVTLDTLNGTGDENDPYVITNATQLQAMEQDLDAYYALGNDINASETAGWNEGKGFDPVGNNSNVFIGEFDGRGHTISNLTIDRPTENDAGLFGLKRGSAAGGAANDVENVTLTNVSVVGNEFVGALVGRSGAAYHQHVYVQGTVTGNESVGGIVGGSGQSSIRNVSANVTVSGTKYIGGIIGFGDVFRILDSSVTGSVDGEMAVGGAVGYLDNSDVTENVSSTATVDGSSEVGGLVGLQAGLIRDSSASGTVSGGTNVGGLVGDARGDIVDSRANGTVTGDTSVGGLVGQVTNDTFINPYGANNVDTASLLSNISATGNVTGDDAVGGLVGELTGGEKYGNEWLHGRIDNASSTAAVAGNTNTGGLVGTMRESASGAPRIQDSWANGTLTTPLDNREFVGKNGGLVGYLQSGTVEHVWANTSIDAEEAVGGLVGRSEGSIRNASSTGDIEGTQAIGGLVGNNTGTVADSTASVSVLGRSDTGGLVGGNYGTVTRSSSTGPVLGGQQFVGGLVGVNLGTTTDSWAAGLVNPTDAIDDPGGVIGISVEATEETLYWDRNATTQSVGVGSKINGGTIENVIGLTTAEMTGAAAASNMSRLDFTNTWATTNRYPQLAFEPAFDVIVTGTNEPVTAGENLTVTAELTNTGDVADRQAIRLTAAGQERARTTAVLEPGQSTTVSLNWSTEAGDGGDSEITVWSPDDSASRTVTVDEPVAEPEPTVDADASNVTATSPHAADGTDTATVTATVVDTAGDPVTGLQTDDFDISVGGNATVASGPTETNAGVYEVGVTDATAESVAVSVTVDGVTLSDEPAIEFRESNPAFFAVNITETNTPVRPGNTVTLAVNVTNTGDLAATQTVSVTAMGFMRTQRDASTVSLEPGASTTVELDWQASVFDEGESAVIVESADDSDSRTVTIQEPLVDPSDSTIETTSPHLADGSDEATVTVTLVNNSGQRVTGLPASEFDIAIDNATVTSGITETEPGVYEFGVTSETVGAEYFDVVVDGVVLFETPVVRFIDPETDASGVEISDIQVTPSAANDGTTVTVRAVVVGRETTVTSTEIGIAANGTDYRATERLTGGSATGDLTVGLDAADLLVDGGYTGFVRVTDDSGETVTNTSGSVSVDTTVADVSSRITGLGTDSATLRIRARENISLTDLVIEAAPEDAATVDRTPTTPAGADTSFDIAFDGTRVGTENETGFTASFTATDEAGNSETVSRNASLTGYEITNDSAVVTPNSTVGSFELATNLSEDGTTFRNGTITQSESPSAGSEIAPNQSASLFIDVVDIGLTDAELTNATVRVPIDELGLDGVPEDELVYFYSPDDSAAFVTVDTWVDGGDLVTTVPGFSQLAPGRLDDEPPTVDSVDVTPGSSLAVDEGPVSVSFDYSPSISAINVSATNLAVTGASGDRVDTRITDSAATADISDLAAGEEIDVVLTVVDEAGNTATERRSISVDDSSSGRDTDRSRSSSSADRDDPAVRVSAGDSETEGSWRVDISDPSTDEPVEISLADETTDDETEPDVSFSGLRMNVNQGSDFELDITTGDAGSDELQQSFSAETGSQSMGTITVDHTIADENIEDVTFTVTLRKSRFADSGLDPESVALYRDESTRWNRLSTSIVDETDSQYTFEATSPGLSTFVIGAAPAATTQPESTDDESATNTTDTTTTTDETDTTDDESPGFGIGIAGLAALVSGVVARLVGRRAD